MQDVFDNNCNKEGVETVTVYCNSRMCPCTRSSELK